MGLTIAQKIIKAHLVSGEMIPGTEIALKIDQTLTQDATGTMAYLEFETMGIDRVRTERSVAYIDHNTLQSGFENADDHRFIQSIAMKYGIYFTPGDHERVAGWMQVHYRLQFDGNGYPRMYFFDTCKDSIRTIPLMTYSETRPEDLDTRAEDHLPDEVRYMCMSRPVRPVSRETEKWTWNPLG